MAKKRLSLDLDLDNYNDKKIWDYLETKKVKSKEIKSILNAYIDGADLPKREEYTNSTKSVTEKNEKEEILNKDDIDSSGFAGF